MVVDENRYQDQDMGVCGRGGSVRTACTPTYRLNQAHPGGKKKQKKGVVALPIPTPHDLTETHSS